MDLPFKTTILMKLKAKTLKYDDTTQVATYRDDCGGLGSKAKTDKMEEIVNLLQAQKTLPPRSRSHALRGEWSGHWDWHVERNWLMLYTLTETELLLCERESRRVVV